MSGVEEDDGGPLMLSFPPVCVHVGAGIFRLLGILHVKERASDLK